MGNYTYLLHCSDGTYYCGWTTDPKRRLKVHNSGKGAKYTRARRPVELVYLERYDTRSEAMKREAAIKKMSHEEKESLVNTYCELTGAL